MKILTRFFTHICERFLPDAFVFCLILSLLGIVITAIATPTPVMDLVQFWGDGFWSLNGFAMQMVLVLLTGHMLASSPLVQQILKVLASLPQGESSALVFVTLISILGCWLNWGFGLIAAALVAVEIGKRFPKLPFGLVAASAYSGFMVWHGGLSGSIPLKIAGNDETLNKIIPGLSIPLSETIFSNWNLGVLVALVVTLPVLTLLMKSDATSLSLALPIETEEKHSKPDGTWRAKIENSRGLMILMSILPLIYIGITLSNGKSLDINIVNLIFLMLNLWAHGTPLRFMAALEKSVRFCGGIIIQYPFYAGLSVLLEKSGLATVLSSWCVAQASTESFSTLCFFAAGLVNFFVPSGGGQWVIQGPIMIKAGLELGVPSSRVAMAIAWGDAWTNMLQPFWLLPLLAMANLKLKDVMGYCVIYCIGGGVILSLALWLF